ncbi:MAG: EexN family lipoprotein [Gammaproteobacteria bacterium]
MKRASILIVCAVVLAGCEEPQPRSVAEFMENEAALQGTLIRCDRDRGAAASDPECQNASRAAERLALIEERALLKARQEAFEREREEYRSRLERERALRRQAEEAAEAARRRALLGGTEFDEIPDSAEERAAPDGQ